MPGLPGPAEWTCRRPQRRSAEPRASESPARAQCQRTRPLVQKAGTSAVPGTEIESVSFLLLEQVGSGGAKASVPSNLLHCPPDLTDRPQMHGRHSSESQHGHLRASDPTALVTCPQHRSCRHRLRSGAAGQMAGPRSQHPPGPESGRRVGSRGRLPLWGSSRTCSQLK